MNRKITSVRELWEEWHHGLMHQPSVEYLETKYGTKWRSSTKESKFFSRRY
ncbi:Short-chain dehydrogenase [Phytophthora megakarya]|uniref:Short-chain dehydrogenase n=1 Tax=Phytophthora megakarya TaxID=4795 RepID=A0A225WWV6_9STRA|nr:Short-chain dehydrogenase [Phytophthora megakarya]